MTFTLALRGRVAFELLAQLQLLELARCGHRDGLHELVGVGQPEPGEVHFQVGVQLVLCRALAFPKDDGGQGPLAPLLVGDGESSTEEIHSPPLFMRSLLRSVILMNPKRSMVTTSPVLNQSSSVNLSSPSGAS